LLMRASQHQIHLLSEIYQQKSGIS